MDSYLEIVNELLNELLEIKQHGNELISVSVYLFSNGIVVAHEPPLTDLYVFMCDAFSQ